jgi:ribosomal protein S18 acetylase RimI-like enzyme
MTLEQRRFRIGLIAMVSEGHMSNELRNGIDTVTMQIREATVTDAAAIARVHVDSWRTTYKGIMPADFLAGLSYERREAFWRDVLSTHGSKNFVYVAEDDGGNVVGFANCGPESTGDLTYRGELYAIYILAEHQRRGIGRLLAAAVAGRLVREGFQSMLVWVAAENPSRLFYEAMGGQRVRQRNIAIGGMELAEVAYGWRDISGLAKM